MNRVKLTDDEFERLLREIVTPDVFASARTFRTINSFMGHFLRPDTTNPHKMPSPDAYE